MLRIKMKAMILAVGLGAGMLAISSPADAEQKSQDLITDAAVAACELMGGEAEVDLSDTGGWVVWCTFSGDSRHCLITTGIFDCPFLNDDMIDPTGSTPDDPYQLPVAPSSSNVSTMMR